MSGPNKYISLTTTTDSVVSKCSSGDRAVTRNAYLLFYRRRTPTPLGPKPLQELVLAAENDNTEDPDSEADDDARSRSGNGKRLDASSRNGSSSAFGHGTAAGAQIRGGGSGPLATTLGPAAADDDLDDDEGFVDAEEDTANLVDNMYSGLQHFDYDHPVWSFEGVGGGLGGDGSDGASDAPNLGSVMGEGDRIEEDFGAEGEADGDGDGDGVAEIRVEEY